MSLRQSLQNIDQHRLGEVDESLQQRLDALHKEEFEAEVLSHMRNYPALNELTHWVLEQAIRDGLTIERAVDRSVGASHALFTLTTFAEIDELPPISSY